MPRDEKGKFKTYDSLGESYADTMEVMRKLIPSHVVFNGKVGALTGKNAMTANVGETVLIVHSQANRDSRPHLIGGHGDHVWETGKFANRPEVDLETWFIRGGSAGAALYTFKQPGIYAYVNHNLIEAVELGAAAHFKVEGKWNDDLMKQVKPPEAIPPKVQGALQPKFEGELRLRWPAGSTIRQASFRCGGHPCCSRPISRHLPGGGRIRRPARDDQRPAGRKS